MPNSCNLGVCAISAFLKHLVPSQMLGSSQLIRGIGTRVAWVYLWMSVLSIAADDLTGPKALKRPLGLRSGTPECPAERAGGPVITGIRNPVLSHQPKWQ